MANGVYNRGLYEIAAALADLDAADLRVLLVSSAYVFAKTHNTVSDVVASEITAAGYARVALTGKVVVEDDANNRAYLDADDVNFAPLAAGQTIGGAVVFRHTGADGTAPLLFFIDLPDTPTTGSAFVLNWAAAASGGIAYLYQP